MGVRGAAVLGGIVLALAGLYLFRYSVEHGWISPMTRVVMAVVAGLGALGVSTLARRRDYPLIANSLAGAGVAILYAAFWAAHRLYGFLGAGPAFALIAATTVLGCLVAARYQSLVIAALGLAGGFATPLLVSGASETAPRLFGYLLVLDLGLVTLAQRRRWPQLALLAVLGTTLHQALYLSWHLRPEESWLFLAVLALFAGLFLFALGRASAQEEPGWGASAALGVLIPFALAFAMAVKEDLDVELLPLCVFLALLSAAACWLGRRGTQLLLPIGASTAVIAIVTAWFLQHGQQVPGWQLALAALGLSLVPAGFAWAAPASADPGRVWSAVTANFGLFAVLELTGPFCNPASSWPWFAGGIALAAVLLALACRPGPGHLELFGGLELGLAIAVPWAMHGEGRDFISLGLYFLLAVALVALWELATAWLRARAESPDPLFGRGSSLAALCLLVALAGGAEFPGWTSSGYFFTVAALAALTLTPSLRLTSLGWPFAAVLATALAEGCGVLAFFQESPAPVGPALCLALLTLLAFVALPFLRRETAKEAAVWAASAAAGPLWYPTLAKLLGLALGSGWGGAPAALLALVHGAALVAIGRSRSSAEAGEEVLSKARLGHGALALLFLTLAIPLQLEREWITLAWAAEALALVWLWRRRPHPGLAWWAAGLFAAVGVRLLLNPEVLSYHPRAAVPVLNWLAITYVLPATAALLAARWLASESASAEPGAAAPKRWLAPALAGEALLLVFAWINLTVFDAFGTGAELSLDLTHRPARDLTLSFAWALYALLLLGLGVARRSPALRRSGLAVLVATILKVFLYDLGELADLYRVASLVGLALSLILVSFAYQKWLAKDEPKPPGPGEGGA